MTLIEGIPATKMQVEQVREIVNWIIEFEASDFEQFPSDTHPYYRALVIRDGVEKANKALRDVLEDS